MRAGKRLLSVVMSVVLVVGLCPGLAYAGEGDGASGSIAAASSAFTADSETFESKDSQNEAVRPEGSLSGLVAQSLEYEYSLDEENNATITKYNGSTSNLVIPDTIDEHVVTGIGGGAFEKNSYVVSVQIPDAVTSIGSGAFGQCSSLSSVSLPKSLKSMGLFAFGRCPSLAAIEVPASLETCGSGYGFDEAGARVYGGAFGGCANLRDVSFERGATRVAAHLLEGSGVESVAVPEGVTTVGDGAFSRCSVLRSVSLPGTLTSIGASSFEYCDALGQISLPNKIDSIGNNAFAACISLSEIRFPDSITSMGSRVCKDCSALKEAYINNGRENLQSGTFENCTSLKKVTLPESLKAIRNGAFRGCSSLDSIEIPFGVTEIEDEAFKNCDALAKLDLPNTVTRVRASAFYDCDNLTSVTLSTGLTTIPSEVFRHCDSLESIVLPYRVQKIESNAFLECPKLTSVTIPRATTTIADSVFSYPGKMTIYGVAGTAAETYANSKSIKFQAQNIPATSIKVDKTALTMNKVDTMAIAADIQPMNFTDEVVWKSTNTDIAKVDQVGNVEAVGVGDATIKLAVGEQAITVKVTVLQPVTGVWLSDWSRSMEGGDTYQLSAEVHPSDAYNKKLAWSSSDPTVASVDQTGKVTALKKGTATITAAAQDGSECTSSCSISVTNDVVVATQVSQLESTHPYANNC